MPGVLDPRSSEDRSIRGTERRSMAAVGGQVAGRDGSIQEKSAEPDFGSGSLQIPASEALVAVRL